MVKNLYYKKTTSKTKSLNTALLYKTLALTALLGLSALSMSASNNKENGTEAVKTECVQNADSTNVAQHSITVIDVNNKRIKQNKETIVNQEQIENMQDEVTVGSQELQKECSKNKEEKGNLRIFLEEHTILGMLSILTGISIIGMLLGLGIGKIIQILGWENYDQYQPDHHAGIGWHKL